MHSNPATKPSTVQALEGITVVDFSHVIAGPFATFHLAALGAKVIKIENATAGGDVMRRKPRAFASINHGKQSLALDLRNPEDQAQAHALVAEADVMVDNMRPGVLASHGLGVALLRDRHPRLIHCTISGYGSEGSWSDRGAYDHVIQAASGMTMMSGSETDGPIKVGFPVVDCATATVAAFAILAALRRRDLCGRGETIDVSMLSVAMQLMYPMVVETLATGETPPRKGNVGYSGSPGADTLECADGLLAIGANTPSQLIRLGDVLGVGAPLRSLLTGQSSGFVSSEHAQEIRQLLAQAVQGQSAYKLEQQLNTAGVAAAVVRGLGQAVQDALASGALQPWTLAGSETVAVPGLGFRASTLFGGQASPAWLPADSKEKVH